MELNYRPVFEPSKKVQKLAQRRDELNRMIGILIDEYSDEFPTPSITTGREISRLSKSLVKSCSQGARGIDSVIVQDILANAKLGRGISNYFFTANPAKVAELLSSVFGNGAYATIIKYVSKNTFPHDAVHNYYRIASVMSSRAIDSELIFDEREFRNQKNRIIDMLNSYRGELDEMFRFFDIAPRLPSYTLVSSPYGFSFFDSGTGIMAIDREKIQCIRAKNGKMRYVKSLGLLVAAHEATHFIHDQISSECFPSLGHDLELYSPIVFGPGTEGVAVYSEDLAFEWIQRNSNRLGVEDEMELLSSFKETYVPRKMMRIASSVFAIQEHQERCIKKLPEHFKTDAESGLAQTTGIPGLGKERYIYPSDTLMDTIFQANYFFGERMVRGIACAAKRKFKLNLANAATRGLLLQSLATGRWTSRKAQERFVLEHFFPQAIKDKII